MKFTKKLLTSALCAGLTLALALTGCGGQTLNTTGDLMAGVRKSSQTAEADLAGPGAQAFTGFGLELFRRSMKATPEENVLVSPLSVLSAMAMTANGAGGQTLSQMEGVLGLPIDQLRAYLAAYTDSLPSGEKAQFHTANSLWVRDGVMRVEKDFLQLNADYFGAGVYQEPFNTSTLEKINSWVNQHTHEMIPSILDEIDSQAVLYLINALAFEAQWEEVYEDLDVREQVFTCQDGQEQNVDMMHSWERTYLEDSEATGFLKYYSGNQYAFAALLPNQGITLAEYVEGLTAEKLRQVLTNSSQQDVTAGIPKFQQDYSASLKDLFAQWGMTDAFEPGLADFSPMGNTGSNGEALYIGDVLHKTYISVFEQGTRAGAVTAVVMESGGAMMNEPKQVVLDRPFLYMIVDTETFLPIFMGAAYTPLGKAG